MSEEFLRRSGGSQISAEVIDEKIYLVRGQKVMLDRDLAVLYGLETRTLNQAVRRNLERFPDDFMYVLTRKEVMRISQFVTSLKFSKTVYAFTEQGVAMLSSVLRSRQAIQVNIEIMRAFVRLKRFIFAHKELAHRLDQLEGKVGKHDREIQVIFEAIRQLMKAPDQPRRKIGFHP